MGRCVCLSNTSHSKHESHEDNQLSCIYLSLPVTTLDIFVHICVQHKVGHSITRTPHANAFELQGMNYRMCIIQTFSGMYTIAMKQAASFTFTSKLLLNSSSIQSCSLPKALYTQLTQLTH